MSDKFIGLFGALALSIYGMVVVSVALLIVWLLWSLNPFAGVAAAAVFSGAAIWGWLDS